LLCCRNTNHAATSALANGAVFPAAWYLSAAYRHIGTSTGPSFSDLVLCCVASHLFEESGKSSSTYFPTSSCPRLRRFTAGVISHVTTGGPAASAHKRHRTVRPLAFRFVSQPMFCALPIIARSFEFFRDRSF
jgi:hypothetical protein